MENETVIYVKERGYVPSIMLFVSAFIIIIGTAITWFEVLGVDFDLHDYDDFKEVLGEESGFGAALVILSVFLMIIALVSLARYHIALKVFGILISVIALLVTFAAIGDISDTFEPAGPVFEWGAGPLITVVGCFIAIISSALIKGPQRIRGVIEKPEEKPVIPSTTKPVPPPQKTQEPSLPKEAVKGQIICKNCSKTVTQISTFCPYCGTYIQENTTQ